MQFISQRRAGANAQERIEWAALKQTRAKRHNPGDIEPAQASLGIEEKARNQREANNDPLDMVNAASIPCEHVKTSDTRQSAIL